MVGFQPGFGRDWQNSMTASNFFADKIKKGWKYPVTIGYMLR
jgi:hypothetical protein